ncbi:MAG: sigma-54-dependent Fis family transcriptional regulator [Acetobacterium sp.]
MFEVNKQKALLSRSHERCIEYGVEKNGAFPVQMIRNEKLNIILERNKELVKVARPFIEIIYSVLNKSEFAISFTDKDGIILMITGEEDIVEDLANTFIVVGTDMSEKSAGTNAMGTALYENCSVQTSGEDHYLTAFYCWTCSAAVIRSEDGDIIGCLNLTGKGQRKYPHTLGLVIAAVKSIENQLKAEKNQNELFNTYQYLNKIMNSINSGIMATDTDGMIKAINHSLCSMLGLKEEEVINKKSYPVLENWEYILDQLRRGKTYENKEIIQIVNKKEKRFDLNVYPIKNSADDIIGMVGIFEDIQNVYNLVNKYAGLSATYTFDDIIGVSKQILKLKEQAKNISNSPSTVLIQGESGTGKELIAQSIHNNSNRKNSSFVAINCGAIPKNLIESEFFGYEEGAFTGASKGGRPGKFEISNGGTLLLDEIGEMPLDMQVSLLRVLQEGCVSRLGSNRSINVDVRIIAATNKVLKEEVVKGTFREDLYYRLSVIPIYVPPLREREGDIELLIKYFLKVKADKLGKPVPRLRYDLYEKLISYSWPGNVREMENCIENIINMDGNITFSFANETLENKQNNLIRSDLVYDMYSLEDWEEKAILNCIDVCEGNMTKAARILGINRSTLYSKIKKYKKKQHF